MDTHLDEKLNILAISYLYPNRGYPDYGIFVHNRLKAVSRYCHVVVINPVPWFPFSFLFDRYRNFDQIPSEESVDGIQVYHPRFFIIPGFLKWMDAFSFFLAVLPRALSLKKKFDLIDLHWTYPDLLSGLLLSKIFKRKFLVTVRGMEALNRFPCVESGTTREYSLRDIITRHCLKAANRVITLSRELMDICCSQGVKPEKALVITNGIDRDRFYYINTDKARMHLGLDLEKTILLVVGSLTYGKGFDRIIRILPKLADQDNNLHLYLIGSEGPAGFFKNELVSLCQEYGVTSHTVFVGQVSNAELVYWYNAADIFCLSSRSEGSPNVLYEALACGCPSVATRVGAVPDIMDPAFQGTIVDNQTEALGQGISKVLSTQYDREKNAKLMDHHTWDQCGKRVVNLYQELVEEHD